MKRSKFNLSNYHLLTCDMGELVPIGLCEALPGDTFQLSSSAMIRVSPLAAPVMHPVSVRIHHFFVPHRLVWTGWEDFITGGPDGNDAQTIPTIAIPAAGSIPGTLFDYFGIGQQRIAGQGVSELPFRGYNAIWNEFFRDQDLQTERLTNDTTLAKVTWGKDYFTTARPWTQKGAEVTVPLGTTAPVKTSSSRQVTGAQQAEQLALASSGALVSDARWVGHSAAGVLAQHTAVGTYTAGGGLYPANLYADLAAGSAITVNDFRRLFALQRYKEARAQYGSRYTEYLRYLGVTPSDARLQRPEYLGGGTTRLNFSEIMQTAAATAPGSRTSFGVGDLYGHGVGGLRSRPIRRFIEEHGYIHSFMSVRPKGIYKDGIHRHFLKKTKEDFWQKELQFIGQQKVLQAEIQAAGESTVDQAFGYQDRYSEYRETPSLIAGEFRSLLDYWHMARDLSGGATLNSAFITCTPTKRIHNVQTNDVLWCMVQNNVVARRMVSRNTSARII